MKRYITLIAILVAIYGAAALPTDSFIEDDTVVAEDDDFLEVPPALVEKTTKGKTMLIIGDSQAEFSSGVAYRTMGMEKKIPQSKYDFTSQCPTITRVINRGVSSSEALEWNKGVSTCPFADKHFKAPVEDATGKILFKAGDVDPKWSPRHCSFQHIIDKDLPAGVKAADIDFVYISLGANDMMQRIVCDRSKLSGVEDEAVGVVGQAVSKFPNAKILLTGYPMPIAKFKTWGITPCLKTEANGNLAVSMVRDLAEGIAKKARAKYPTRVDHFIDVGKTFGMFGGTPTTWTNNATFGSHVDPIHMTTAGYTKLFGRADVKKAMGCGSSPPKPTPKPPPPKPTPAPPPVNECQNNDATLKAASSSSYETCDSLKKSCTAACEKDVADANKDSKGDYTKYWCTINKHKEAIAGFCPGLCKASCQVAGTTNAANTAAAGKKAAAIEYEVW